MDKELKKLIDKIMAPLERFSSERKRIVAAVLAESSIDLPHDDHFSAWANSLTQELERREILRRGQESWMMRHLIDRLSQLGGEENFPLPKSETHGAETKVGSVTGQFQESHDSEQL